METKEKVIMAIILTLSIISFAVVLVFGIYTSENYFEEVETQPESTTTTSYLYMKNELATFHGGVGEVTYETVIYKIDNNKSNLGFIYENKTCTTKSWGSTEKTCRTTKTGEVTWTDDVFPVAKANGAYSYVTRPNDNRTYTIEEFEKIFIMD